MNGGLIAAFALLLLAVSPALAAKCTAASFQTYYTDCDTKTQTRNQIFFPIEQCSGGVNQPANKFGIPCTCAPGFERNATTGLCAECAPGAFNPGGLTYGSDAWRSWNATTLSPSGGSILFPAEGVTLFCEGAGCKLWAPDQSDGSLSSGNHRGINSISTMIVITKRFSLADGNRVEFQYRVDAEVCRNSYFACDGISFYIDDVRMLPDAAESYSTVGQQLTWRLARFNVTQGTHTLKWVYSKDSSVTAGADRAYLKQIVLAGAIDLKGGCGAGTTLYTPTCAQCPAGKYSPLARSSDCLQCPWFSVSAAPGSTGCTPCPTGSFAYPGSDRCQPLPNCTSEDYVTLRTPPANCTAATGYTYATTSAWRTVSIGGLNRLLCLPTPAVPLPSRVAVAGACTCEQGQFLDTTAGRPARCAPCPAGTYNDGTAATCRSCPQGSVASPLASRTEWSQMNYVSCDTAASGVNGEFCSTCFGDDCPTAGWIAGGAYAGTPRAVGNVDVKLGWRTLAVKGGATLTIDCSVQCDRADVGQLASRDDCMLSFSFVNESGLAPDGFAQFNCSGSTPAFRDGRRLRVTKTLPATANGTYTLMATFHQRDATKTYSWDARLYNLTLTNTKFGGGGACTPCGDGQRSDPTGTMCLDCGPGLQATTPQSDRCVPCAGNSYSGHVGDACATCGAHANANAQHTGCDASCSFVGDVTGKTYNLNGLGNPGGDMVLAGSVQSYYVWPPVSPSLFYLNPCTRSHSKAQCTDANNVSYPYMACQATASGVYDLGSQIGYTETARGQITLTLAGGDPCGSGAQRVNRNTTVYLSCKKVGLGQPAKPLGNGGYEPRRCQYEFRWETEMACPQCAEEDFVELWGPCLNRTQTSVVLNVNPCTGGLPQPAGKTQACVQPTRADAPPPGHVYVVADARVSGLTAEGAAKYPSTLALAVPAANLVSAQVTVLDVQGDVVTFRVDVQGNAAAAAVTADELKTKLTSDKADAGALVGEPEVKAYVPPAPLVVAAAGKKLTPGAVAAIVLLVLALGGALGFFVYKNRQLKYQNYLLVSAGGVSGGNTLDDDLYNDDSSSDTAPFHNPSRGVTFHNFPQPDSAN